MKLVIALHYLARMSIAFVLFLGVCLLTCQQWFYKGVVWWLHYLCLFDGKQETNLNQKPKPNTKQNVRQTFVSKTNVVPKTNVCIKRFLNHVFIDKKIYALAPKKELVCVLPFIGKKLLHLRSKLVKSVQNNLRFCHLRVVFQSPDKLHTLFCFKDTADKKRQSRLKTNS